MKGVQGHNPLPKNTSSRFEIQILETFEFLKWYFCNMLCNNPSQGTDITFNHNISARKQGVHSKVNTGNSLTSMNQTLVPPEVAAVNFKNKTGSYLTSRRRVSLEIAESCNLGQAGYYKTI